MKTPTIPNRTPGSTRLSLMLLALCLPTVHAETWDDGGPDNDWLTAGNWDPDSVPNAVDAEATFNTDEGFVKHTGDIILGTLNYTLGSGSVIVNSNPSSGTLTFDVSSGDAEINVASGGLVWIYSQTILNDTLVINGDGEVRTGSSDPVFSGAGGIIVNGEFRTHLGGTYTGVTTVNNGGTMRLNTSGNLGATTSGTVVNAGGLLNLFGADVGSEAITLNGGTLQNSSDAGANGRVDGLITLGADSTIDVGRRIDHYGGLDLAGNTLTKTGTDGLVLRGTDPTVVTDGDISIDEGTLTLQDGLQVQGSGSIQLNGGTLGFWNTVAGNITRDIELMQDSTFQVGSGADNQVDGIISGGFNLTKTGNSTLTLTAENTYTGETTAANGLLRIAPASTATSSAWDVIDGSLQLQDDSGAPIENLIGAPPVLLDGGTLEMSNNTETIGDLTMDSSFAPSTLVTANNGAGTTTATLTVDTLDLFGTENFVSFDAAPLPGTYEVMNANAVNGTLGTNLLVADIPALYQTWSFTGGVVSVELQGNDITYTNASTAAMWTINADTDWTDGSPVGYNNYDDVTFNDTASGFPGTLSVDIADTVAPSSVTVDNASGNDYTFTGSDISGWTGLTKNGAGTLTFEQDNTYTGTTDINGGTLQVGNGGTSGLIGTGAVDLAGGATLIFNRSSFPAFDNNITADGTLRHEGTGFLDLNGNITGSGDIIQAPGAATFALDGQNNFSGNITLDNGTSFIRGGGSTYSGNISLALGTELDFGSSSGASAGDVLVTGIISGDGNLDVNLGNGEKAILTGENTYTGTTSIGSNDTLQIGDGGTTGSLGAGDVDMDVSTSVLIFNRTDTVNVANNFVLDGSIRQEGSGDLNLNGNITIDDSNGDIVTTAGTTSLNGGLTCEVNTTSVDSQTLVVTGALNLGGATLSLIETNPGTLAGGTKTTLIDYTGGSLTGTFAGLAEGATVTLGTNDFTISYADASQVTLTAVASGYSTWAATNAGGQGPDLDFDGDGVPNGVEYFMGETGSSFTPNPGIVGGTITWPKDPSANATYVVEVSSNLQDEVVPGDGGWTAADPGDVVDNGTSVVYTVPTGDPRLFTRLRVIIP